MSRARDKANSTVSNFASTGIDDNADATAITIDSSERVGIATPATSSARCLLHTHPSGTGSIPTNYLVQQDDNNLGLVIMNTNDSSTYSGLRIETRSTQAAGWLVANEFQSAFNGDLVFRARNAGSTSAEIARMKSSGGITFNGDTAAANALDDYEEGTWTPTLSGASTAGSITYQTQSGYYTKIGNIVHIDMRIIYTAFSGSSGAARIAGLPYNVSNATSYAPVSSNWMTFGNTFDTAGFPIFYGVVNADRFHGLVSKNNTAWADWASSDFHLAGGTKYLNLTATYQTG